VVIIYLVSNLPFLIDVFMQDNNGKGGTVEDLSYLKEYYKYIHTKMIDGEALTYVCAFIAPVILWTTLDEKTKRPYKAFLLAITGALCLLSTAIYVSGRESVFLSGFELYCAALITWIFCVVLRYFPPEPNLGGKMEIKGISEHINSSC